MGDRKERVGEFCARSGGGGGQGGPDWNSAGASEPGRTVFGKLITMFGVMDATHAYRGCGQPRQRAGGVRTRLAYTVANKQGGRVAVWSPPGWLT